jgi:hypothetical protein
LGLAQEYRINARFATTRTRLDPKKYRSFPAEDRIK